MIHQLEGLIGVYVACPVCSAAVQVRATKTGKGMIRCDACKTLLFMNGPIAVVKVRDRMLPGQIDPCTGMMKVPFNIPPSSDACPANPW